MKDLMKDALLMRLRIEKAQHPAGFKPTTSLSQGGALALCYNRCQKIVL